MLYVSLFSVLEVLFGFLCFRFGYSSLKNKVTWQVISFKRDVFVERAELSASS